MNLLGYFVNATYAMMDETNNKDVPNGNSGTAAYSSDSATSE